VDEEQKRREEFREHLLAAERKLAVARQEQEELIVKLEAVFSFLKYSSLNVKLRSSVLVASWRLASRNIRSRTMNSTLRMSTWLPPNHNSTTRLLC
jgi:hypothetical protein